MKLIGFETVGGFCGFVALVLLVVVGLGRCSKRLLGVSGSASAFVFFNILFIWAVYLAVLRPGAFFLYYQEFCYSCSDEFSLPFKIA